MHESNDQVVLLNTENPDTRIVLIKNAIFDNNEIILHDDTKRIDFLPSMYQSWTIAQQQHVNIRYEKDSDNLNEQYTFNNIVLYIFDTWGLSSYYHLLIDHLLPLWITKKKIEGILDHEGESVLYRISKNNYENELATSNEIFRYFFNQEFKDSIVPGRFAYIVYGYLYPFRPYHGPLSPLKYYAEYQQMFDVFTNEFSTISNIPLKERYIIIPIRSDRTFCGMQEIAIELNKEFHVKTIDFGVLPIHEQITMCGSAWAMIGSDGANLSNQIFMKKGSLLVTLCHEELYQFHVSFTSTLAQYLNHDLHVVTFNNHSEVCHVVQQVVDIAQLYTAYKSSDTF